MELAVVRILAVVVIASLGFAAPAMAIGLIGHTALTGLARNPEAKQSILTTMILAIAFAEAIAIYALIIAIVLLFVV